MIARAIAAAAIAAIAAHAALADAGRVRLLEGAGAATLTGAELNAEVKGYLTPGTIDGATLLAPPPAIDSSTDKADVAMLKAVIASANAERWQDAVADDASVYDRFAEPLLLPPDRAHLPRLVNMLNRVAEDVIKATGEAKKKFARPRPFQRLALKRVCGKKNPPKPESNPAKADSYPSGHASISWGTALVMMEVVPDQAGKIISRAVEYGNSRLVCGVHFPSDVEAGRIVAATVIDKLMTVPEFRRDVACAKREYVAVLAGQKSEDLPACQ